MRGVGWIQSPPPRCAEAGTATAAGIIGTDRLHSYAAASDGARTLPRGLQGHGVRWQGARSSWRPGPGLSQLSRTVPHVRDQARVQTVSVRRLSRKPRRVRGGDPHKPIRHSRARGRQRKSLTRSLAGRHSPFSVPLTPKSLFHKALSRSARCDCPKGSGRLRLPRAACRPGCRPRCLAFPMRSRRPRDALATQPLPSCRDVLSDAVRYPRLGASHPVAHQISTARSRGPTRQPTGRLLRSSTIPPSSAHTLGASTREAALTSRPACKSLAQYQCGLGRPTATALEIFMDSCRRHGMNPFRHGEAMLTRVDHVDSTEA